MDTRVRGKPKSTFKRKWINARVASKETATDSQVVKMSQYGQPDDIDAFLRPVLLKDFRVQLRARGLSPAGNRDLLSERLKQAMIASGDYTFKNADGSVDVALTQSAYKSVNPALSQEKNNYHRPEGQNVGNFLTDRNTSRVLAPPGGGSQVCLGDAPQRPQHPQAAPVPVQQQPMPPQASPAQAAAPGMGQDPRTAGVVESKNNYSRPGGMQNVGNFLTDRNSSRVLAPPGGHSNVSFG